MRSIPISPEQALAMKDATGIPLSDDAMGMTIVSAEGKILANVICCNWTETSCFVHMMIKDSKVLESNFLANEIFHFTFGTMERMLVLATASSLNEGSLALQRAYGFEEICRISDAISQGEDMVISRLTREEYQKRRAH